MTLAYDSITFPSKNRPYYFSNFVSTIDGKVQVLVDTEKYWPLGSTIDYETLIDLRTYADVLIHGKNTAVPHPTLRSLSKEPFQETRQKRGKTEPIWYVVISNNPDESLIPVLKDAQESVKPLVVTSEDSSVPLTLEAVTEVIRLGEKAVDLQLVNKYFKDHNKEYILVEGGPTLMGSFFKEDLIDEIFLTIAPKVIGNKSEKTLTMVEGFLLPPEKVKKYKLFSVKRILDEVFLRYRK